MVKIIAGFRDRLTDVIYPVGSGHNGEHIEGLTKAGSLREEAKTRPEKTE